MNFGGVLPSYTFAALFFVATIICAFMSTATWQKRNIRGAFWFSLMMLAVSIWAMASGLEVIAIGVDSKVLASKFQYLGSATIGPLWLFFTISFIQQDRLLPRYARIAIWFIPLVTVTAAFTNEYHHLLWTYTIPASQDINSYVIYGHGPVYWVNLIYAYALMLFGTIALAWAIFAFPTHYRRQALALIGGAFFPWIINFAYAMGFNAQLDITALGFTVSGLVFMLAIFRYQLFDILPVAREKLIDIIDDLVIVLDAQDRVVDINTTGLNWIEKKHSEVIGKKASEIFIEWQDIFRRFANVYEGRDEVRVLRKDNTFADCEIIISPLEEAKDRLGGRLVILRNISHRKKIEEQNLQQTLELVIVNQLSQAVASQLELGKLIQLAGDQISKIFMADGVYIALFDKPNQTILFPYWQTHGRLIEEPGMPYGQGLTSLVLKSHKPLLINNFTPEIGETLGALPSSTDTNNNQTKSWMAVPIMVAREPIGVLSAFSYTNKNAFSDSDIRLMNTIAATVGIAIENAKLYENAQAEIQRRTSAEASLREANALMQSQLHKVESLQAELREQAIRDPLTGLFNRRYMEETLQREVLHASRAHTHVSILIMDIDKFKNVNDAYGHKAGDCMLQAFSQLLLSHTRGSDVVCRYGGEEFVIIFTDTMLESALQRAEQLRYEFQNLLVKHDDAQIRATISIGVAVFPEHGATGESVLIKADQALYVAKQTGRNKVVVFNEQQHKEQ